MNTEKNRNFFKPGKLIRLIDGYFDGVTPDETVLVVGVSSDGYNGIVKTSNGDVIYGCWYTFWSEVPIVEWEDVV